MTFFDDLIKKIDDVVDVVDRFVCRDGPNDFIPKYQPASERTKRKIEKIADDISPIIGDIIKKINNFDSTIQNGKDSIDVTKRLSRVLSEEEYRFQLGDHLVVQRSIYTHHGVYIGEGEVIHYADSGVEKVPLQTFSNGAKIFRKSSYKRHSPGTIVYRAYSRLNEDQYNLLTNNCEHFVEWCRSG
jgi:hypothetical protein